MKTKEYSMREMIIDQCLGTGREFTREDVTLTRAHWRNRKGNFSHGVNFKKKVWQNRKYYVTFADNSL